MARLVANDISVPLKKAFEEVGTTMSSAVQGMMVDIGAEFKAQVRADIGAAGFSPRWQNAWRVRVFPERGASLDAAVLGRHNVPYSAVFEEGAQIVAGSGRLWIPLNTAPKVGRRNRPSPKDLIAQGVRLFPLRGTHKPLLAANVPVGVTNPSLSDLKMQGGGPKVALPLFVGVDSVNVQKRFHVGTIAEKLRGQLAAMYARKVRAGA